MAAQFSGQRKQQKRFTVKEVLSNLELMIVTLALTRTVIAILMNCINRMNVMVMNLLPRTVARPMTCPVMRMFSLQRLLVHRWSQIVLQKLTGGERKALRCLM